MAERIANFDDWKDLFYKWQKDIGFDPARIKDYKFDAFYAEPPHAEIEFGVLFGTTDYTPDVTGKVNMHIHF